MRAHILILAAAGVVSTLGAVAACTGATFSSASGDGGETTSREGGASSHTSGGSSSSGHGQTDAGSTSSGGDAGAKCDPTKAPSVAPCTITDALGVFVAPHAKGGNDTPSSGTMAAPFATMGYAIARAGTRRVYVCAATYELSVPVATMAKVAVFGGLACPASPGSGAGAGGVAA